MLLTLALTSLCVNYGLKNLVMRNRPFVSDPTIIPRITPPTSTSFPSGHSATSLCCSAFLFLSEKNLFGKCSALLGVLIALSRLILLVHYPTDVLAGGVVGILIGVLMYHLMNKIVKTSA